MKEFKRPQKMLGPSQVVTVLGYSPFQTAEQLKDQMENGYLRDICSKRTAGTRDESRCRTLYIKETGNKVKKCNFVKDQDLNGRFGGCGDGLVDNDGGLEIKCQYTGQVPKLYFSYKLQAVAYMYLYKRQWWDIMVCSIDSNDKAQVIIDRIYFKDYEQSWNNAWYPSICKFCYSVKWA